MQSTNPIASSLSRQCVPLVSFRSNLLFAYIPSRNSSAIFSREGLSNPTITVSLQGLASLQVQLTLDSTTPISPGQVRRCLFFSTPCAQTDPPFPFCHVFQLSSAFLSALIDRISTFPYPLFRLCRLCIARLYGGGPPLFVD